MTRQINRFPRDLFQCRTHGARLRHRPALSSPPIQPTLELTDCRRERTLPASAASEESGASKPRRLAAVRCSDMVWQKHFHQLQRFRSRLSSCLPRLPAQSLRSHIRLSAPEAIPRRIPFLPPKHSKTAPPEHHRKPAASTPSPALRRSSKLSDAGDPARPYWCLERWIPVQATWQHGIVRGRSRTLGHRTRRAQNHRRRNRRTPCHLQSVFAY